MATLEVSSEETNDIKKIWFIDKTIKNEAKEQKDRCLSIILGTLVRAVVKADEETIRASQDFNAASSFD